MPDDPLALGADTPTNDSLTQHRNDALSRSSGAIETAVGSINKETELAQRKSAEMAPLRERAMQQVSQPLPEPPKLKEPPAPPKQGGQGADEGWLLAVQVLGGLVGAATRRPLTNALAGMTGAVQGYQEGNRQKFDENLAIWDRENKAAVESNQKALDEYKMILENRKLNEQQITMALQIAAARHEDDAMAQAAKTKSSLVIAQLYDRQFEAFTRMKTSSDSLRQQHMTWREQQWESQAAQYAAKNTHLVDAILSGKADPPPKNPRTGLQGAIDRAITSELYTRNPNYNPNAIARDNAALKASATSEARARAQIEPATERRTLGAFSVGPEGRSVRSLNVAIDHLDSLKELTAAMQNGDVNTINRIKNYFQAEFGVSAPTSFDGAKQIIGNEIIKAVTPTGGGVFDRKETAEIISRARSPEQLNQMIATYQRLLAGQMKGLKKQYESGSNRSDFDTRYLEDATKRELDALIREGIPNPPNELKDTINRIAAYSNASAMHSARQVGQALEQKTKSGMLEQQLKSSGYKTDVPAKGLFGENVPGTHHAAPAPDMPIMLPEGWKLHPMGP